MVKDCRNDKKMEVNIKELKDPKYNLQYVKECIGNLINTTVRKQLRLCCIL